MTPEDKEAETERVRRWTNQNKERVKAYHKDRYEAKKAEISEQAKVRYQLNKDFREAKKAQAKAYAREKRRNSPQVVCGCGSTFKEFNRRHHIVSKKHLAWEL
jgi:hypothetical protein